jgi:hypothetical protein
MNRSDLSQFLFHWVSGNSSEEALNLLHAIIVDEKIYGSSNNIKGSYSCVCFTEAPIEHFNFDASRYWPFGISISKLRIFQQGGRPVIYQRDSEFYDLPESLRWRHVRYEPDSESQIDFTWEREWRIQTNELPLDPDSMKIIVPNRETANELEARFNQAQWDRYHWECVGYGEDLARYPEPLIYSIKLIDDN